MTVSAALPRRRPAGSLRRVTSTTGGKIGLVFLVVGLAICLFGGNVAPYDPSQPFGIPGSPPMPGHPLGLDFIGRDVLSRVLYAGRATVVLAVGATTITYVVGGAIGLLAGYRRGPVDAWLMRTMDVLLSVPALLVILLFVTAFGNAGWVLVLSAALVLMPGVARIVRSATAEIATRGYVEAAVARGDRTLTILRREVLPNIAGVVIADLGLRFSWSIILIASVNFLGLGIQPPLPELGLMVSENRVIIGGNPDAILAPSIVLAVLIIGVNLVGDAFVRQLDRSEGGA
ncbi:MAG TPA: ABC transporter permease [Rhodoglobus sp.]|nr:ABC transporter permease [Rhodoglobus sp.]